MIISYKKDPAAEAILLRLQKANNARAMELDYYIEGKLQLLQEDTDVKLRQLETLTPVINKYKRSQKLRTEYLHVVHTAPIVIDFTDPSTLFI